jgi:hypothetical protein
VFIQIDFSTHYQHQFYQAMGMLDIAKKEFIELAMDENYLT